MHASAHISSLHKLTPFFGWFCSQDGVLCHSEEISRQAACEVMRELYGLEVQPEEFLPFTVGVLAGLYALPSLQAISSLKVRPEEFLPCIQTHTVACFSLCKAGHGGGQLLGGVVAQPNLLTSAWLIHGPPAMQGTGKATFWAGLACLPRKHCRS